MIYLIGTGGHAKVVFEAMVSDGTPPDSILPRDGKPALHGEMFMNREIRTPEIPEHLKADRFHVAIGNNTARASLHDQAVAAGLAGHTVIHPDAVISPTARLGPACLAAAGSIVAAMAQVGDSTIVNHNCVVDHDCQVGKFCHIAPGAVLGGSVSIGDGTLVGSGAVVLPGLTVGRNVTIGAGSVVTKSVTDGKTWIGASLAK